MYKSSFSIALLLAFVLLAGDQWLSVLINLLIFAGFAVLYGLYLNKKNYPENHKGEKNESG